MIGRQTNSFKILECKYYAIGEVRMSSNLHISSYLDYYTEIEVAPEYGVLINGDWGAGKTYFIKEYIKVSEKKFIYITLYGLSSVQDIEEAMFRELNPILGSQPVAILKELVKTTAKATFRIDINNDEKDDVVTETNFNFPGIKLDNEKQKKEKVFVFDDIERYSGDLSGAMGYINKLIEHSGSKVILIANSERVKDPSFKETKEKLVGCSLHLIADQRNATNAFVKNYFKEPFKSLFERHFEIINRASEEMKCQNLRLVLIFLRNFERTFQKCDEKVLQNNKFVEEVIYVFIKFSFIYHTGTFNFDELEELSERSQRPPLKDSDQGKEEEKRKNNILSDFGIKGLSDIVFDILTWRKIIEGIYIDPEDFNEFCLGTSYFVDASKPTWRRLWYYECLSDDEFDKLLNVAKEDLKTGLESDVRVLFHYAGLLIFFTENSFVEDEITDIKKLILSAFQLWFSEQSLDHFNWKEVTEDRSNWGFFGNAVMGRKLASFKAVCSEVDKMVVKLQSKQNMAFAKDLPLNLNDLKLLEENLNNFSQSPKYYAIPVLHLVNVEQFFTALELKSNETKSRVFYMFQCRYIGKYSCKVSSLIIELKFLVKLKAKIDKLILESSGYKLSHVINLDGQRILAESIQVLTKLREEEKG